MEVEESAHQCYLARLMPIGLLYDMLCRGHTQFYRTLGFSKHGIYWRDKKRLIRDRESFARELAEFEPEQLHFGSLDFQWGTLLHQRWHEVALDLDLTDYQRYCGCGEKKQACRACWLHMEGSQLVLHHLLCDVLGISGNHLLWVFSGKKGIHCLCNDPHLALLDQRGRDRLLAVLNGHSVPAIMAFVAEAPPEFVAQVHALFLERGIQHHHRRLMRVPAFRQHCLTTVRRHWPALYEPLALAWHQPRVREPEQDWATLQQLEREQGVPASLVLALQCFWPRVDGGPLLLDHLYKLPFSVHADTLRVALPVERLALVSDALPEQALTRQTAVECYRRTGAAPQEFLAGQTLFARWLQAHVAV